MGGIKTEHGAVKVKQEPDDAESSDKKKRGFSKSAKEHYTYQVQFIESQVDYEWKVCFGALGTGFVAVCPSAPSKLEPVKKQAKIKKEPDTVAESASSEKGKADEDEVDNPDEQASIYAIPSNSILIIFINAPACAPQSRGNRALGNYEETIDQVSKTFTWSSQRRDKNNAMINAIMSHSERGGRIVCGVRPADKDDKFFKFLGQVSYIDGLQPARFLINDGDTIIQESGSCMFHKTIVASCLTMSLKSGIGLNAVKYPIPQAVEKRARFCLACTWRAPKAVLHFDEMSDEGVKAFKLVPKRCKGEPAEEDHKLKEEDLVFVKPEKRLRFKQTVVKTEPVVKCEIEEEKAEPVNQAPETPTPTSKTPLESPMMNVDAQATKVKQEKQPKLTIFWKRGVLDAEKDATKPEIATSLETHLASVPGDTNEADDVPSTTVR